LEKLLGIGRSTIHRVLKGLQKPPEILRIKLCEVVSEEKLLKVLKGRDILMRYGLIQMGRSTDSWILRIPIVIRAGEIAELRIFNTPNTESAYEAATQHSIYYTLCTCTQRTPHVWR